MAAIDVRFHIFLNEGAAREELEVLMLCKRDAVVEKLVMSKSSY